MADQEDRASIEVVKKLVHRVGQSHERCTCVECTAIRRVCVLATEAVEMKAAKQRRDFRDKQLKRKV